jgi:hypothetical protein
MTCRNQPHFASESDDDERLDLELANYVADELDGKRVERLYPELHQKLRASAVLRWRYETLRAIEQAERQDRFAKGRASSDG